MTTQAEPLTAVDLGGEWSFAVAARRVDLGDDPPAALAEAGAPLRPARVPGNVELDLQRNGEIGDPFVGMAITGLRWLERCYVYYVRRFRAPDPATRIPILVFEGLDCDARILLNGRLVAETASMLVEHRIPVGAYLRHDADNLLVVELEPVMCRAERMVGRYPPGLQAEGGSYAALHVRKAPHMFGWDIMPRALSAGIWRPVTLRYEAPERIGSLWLDTESLAGAAGAAVLALHHEIVVGIDPSEPPELVVTGSCGDSRFEHRSTLLFGSGCLRFTVESPRLWWPRGRGEACLYDVTVELRRAGRVLDATSFRHGIRTVALERSSVTDADGSGQFRFIVNDEPVFVLGTNWVPLDAYHSRDLERLPAALALIEELGCNLVRCWGGNVYEHDAFYDRCDETGILVWQDFAMACAIYPQDEAFQAVMRDEVRQVVRRLRQHPCLLVWAGDNECDEQYVYKSRRRDPNRNVITRKVIPGVLRDEDPSRPYLPSSPYVDEVAFASGVRTLPEDHLWGPRDYYKSAYYRTAVPHFASEIGYAGSPSVESLRRFLSPEWLWPHSDNPEWLLHATSPFPGVDTHDYRVELMATQVRALFGVVPETLEDFVSASQASQAEGLKFFIESFRAGKWRRTGIVWWNLLDGWPQFSDAVVDYYLVKKQAFEVVKRVQVPICLILREPEGGRQELVVSNDTRVDEPVRFTVVDVPSGTTLTEGRALARGDAVTTIESIAAPGRRSLYLLTWESRQSAYRSHYLAGEPPFALDDYRAWMGQAGL